MMQLPSDIRTILKERGLNDHPDLVLRALNSLSGDLGEAYTFVDQGKLMIFSRRIGSSFQEVQIPIADIQQADLVEDRPFAYLKITGSDVNYDLKFSGLDDKPLLALEFALSSARQDTGDVASVADMQADAKSVDDVELTPVIGFCAAVYAMMQADGAIDDKELELLNQMIDHPPTVLKGLDALRRLGPVSLFERLNDLMSEQQKLCMMANLVEMSMIDGLVRAQERNLLRQVRDVIGIDQSNFDAIFEVLMIKNDRSIFEINE